MVRGVKAVSHAEAAAANMFSVTMVVSVNVASGTRLRISIDVSLRLRKWSTVRVFDVKEVKVVNMVSWGGRFVDANPCVAAL